MALVSDPILLQNISVEEHAMLLAQGCELFNLGWEEFQQIPGLFSLQRHLGECHGPQHSSWFEEEFSTTFRKLRSWHLVPSLHRK